MAMDPEIREVAEKLAYTPKPKTLIASIAKIRRRLSESYDDSRRKKLFGRLTLEQEAYLEKIAEEFVAKQRPRKR